VLGALDVRHLRRSEQAAIVNTCSGAADGRGAAGRRRDVGAAQL